MSFKCIRRSVCLTLTVVVATAQSFAEHHNQKQRPLMAVETSLEYDYVLSASRAGRAPDKRIRLNFYIGTDRGLCTLDGVPYVQWDRTSDEMRSFDVQTSYILGRSGILFDYSLATKLPADSIILTDQILLSLAGLSKKRIGIARARDEIEQKRDFQSMRLDKERRKDYRVKAIQKKQNNGTPFSRLVLTWSRGHAAVTATAELAAKGTVDVAYMPFPTAGDNPQEYQWFIMSRVRLTGAE